MINRGISKDTAQNNDILPKFLCQKCGAIKGNIAIESKIPIKGITQKMERSAPLKCGASWLPGKAKPGKKRIE